MAAVARAMSVNEYDASVTANVPPKTISRAGPSKNDAGEPPQNMAAITRANPDSKPMTVVMEVPPPLFPGAVFALAMFMSYRP
jgi:hypothetical protein